MPWQLLPIRELGCGSPVTCWRRLRGWQRAGIWQQPHLALFTEVGRQGQLDWSRASLDSLSVRAKRGCLTGPNPTDHGKPGRRPAGLLSSRWCGPRTGTGELALVAVSERDGDVHLPSLWRIPLVGENPGEKAG